MLKYVSFVSSKKDGTPAATAVWLVPFEGGYAFTTDAEPMRTTKPCSLHLSEAGTEQGSCGRGEKIRTSGLHVPNVAR